VNIAAQEEAGLDRRRFPYKMKDLSERTGLPRQVIHFYIQQGLVPEGHKTGRNMAYYAEEHVERVLLVRRLQHERFLPLKAIRAMLEHRDDSFSPAQRALLRDVQARLTPALADSTAAKEIVDATALLETLGLVRDDLDGFVEIGLLAVRTDDEGHTFVARDDVWMLEAFAELRRAGMTAELGFTSRDFALYEEAIASLFHRETKLIAERLSDLPPDMVAATVERALPVVNQFLAQYHTARIRNFFATL